MVEAFKKGFSEKAFKDAADNLGATAAWEGPKECLRTMEIIGSRNSRVAGRGSA
jgi:hypothetical protein